MTARHGAPARAHDVGTVMCTVRRTANVCAGSGPSWRARCWVGLHCASAAAAQRVCCAPSGTSPTDRARVPRCRDEPSVTLLCSEPLLCPHARFPCQALSLSPYAHAHAFRNGTNAIRGRSDAPRAVQARLFIGAVDRV
eukprot:364806-Chlamydomonas_euryale.AAC.15